MNFIPGRLPRLAKVAERMTINATDLRSPSTVLSRVAELRADTASALNGLTQARGGTAIKRDGRQRGQRGHQRRQIIVVPCANVAVEATRAVRLGHDIP